MEKTEKTIETVSFSQGGYEILHTKIWSGGVLKSEDYFVRRGEEDMMYLSKTELKVIYDLIATALEETC